MGRGPPWSLFATDVVPVGIKERDVAHLAAGIFLPSEAKLEAGCPPSGQMSLQGTWGGRKSAALFLLVPQGPSRGVKAASPWDAAGNPRWKEPPPGRTQACKHPGGTVPWLFPQHHTDT